MSILALNFLKWPFQTVWTYVVPREMACPFLSAGVRVNPVSQWIVPHVHYSLVNNVSPRGISYPHSYQWMLHPIQYSLVIGFRIPKKFSSYNIPKVTASTARQVLISDRTLTFSESSSLRGKRAYNILPKYPPMQKIGITCFLWCAVQRRGIQC